jgi:hypothetical protein
MSSSPLSQSLRGGEAGHLETAQRMSAAATDLPIEAIFSMVMEGLNVLAAYRVNRPAFGAERSMSMAVASPRSLFAYFHSLVEDFVVDHDMDDENSLQEFSATVVMASKSVEPDIDKVFLSAGIIPSSSEARNSRPQSGRIAVDDIDDETAGGALMGGRYTSGDGAAKGKRYYAILAAVRDAFSSAAEEEDDDDDANASPAAIRMKTIRKNNAPFTAGSSRKFASMVSPRIGGSGATGFSKGPGMPEVLFCEFVAPALTLSRDVRVNQKFIARTNVTQSGFITWDAFSNFFVKLHGDLAEEATQVQFVSPASAVQHNAAVRKLLFTRQRSSRFGGTADDRSVNPAMDRYCLSGGYDGTVHMWDTNFYDHAVRLHYIPNANKAKRWVNDMSYTSAGRLAIAQSRGLVYLYSLLNPLKPYLHRVFRSNSLMSEDEEVAVRTELERVRMQQGKTRFTAADCPPAEFCVLNSPVPGDITTVHGPRRLSKFSHASHMEPLLVGLDSGLVHLYNVYKPIEFKAQISPMITFNGFSKADVFQVADHPLDNSYLVAGRDVRGLPSIQIVDYEKSEAMMILQPHKSSLAAANGAYGGIVPSLTRFDFDDSIGLIAASGATRSATIFSTSFPDPVTVLADHSAPVVGAAVNASQYQIFTFTEDHTFHLFDLRMFRKVQTFCDTSANRSDTSGVGSLFACGGYDGTRGVAVGAASTPVALQIQQQTFGPSGGGAAAQGNRGGAASTQAAPSQSNDALTPSGLATDLRRVLVCNSYQSLIAAEGNFLVTRSGESFQHQDSVASMPTTIVDIALDHGERRTAVLLQGRQVQILSTMGGNRVGKWSCTELDSMDEGTCICFAHRPVNQPVVAVGTFEGVLAVYDIVADGELVAQFSFGSAVLCVAPAGVGQQRLLVGTALGDVFLVNLETLSIVKVLEFETVHEPFREALDFGGMKEKETADLVANRKKLARVDSLASFRNRAHASMDKSVEAFSEGFDATQSVILYGSGATLLVRISHAEVIPLLQFPAVRRHTSACSVAVRRVPSMNLDFAAAPSGSNVSLLVAVGDFNGGVTVFRVDKVAAAAARGTTSPTSVAHVVGTASAVRSITKGARGGHNTAVARRPSSDSREASPPPQVPANPQTNQRISVVSSSASTTTASYEDYKVALVNQLELSTASLVGNVSFADDDSVVACLSEQLQIVSFSIKGWVQTVLSHSSNGKSDEAASMAASTNTQLTPLQPPMPALSTTTLPPASSAYPSDESSNNNDNSAAPTRDIHPFYVMIKGTQKLSSTHGGSGGMSPACPSVTDTDDFIKLSSGAAHDKNRAMSLQSATNEPLALFEGGDAGTSSRPGATAMATPHPHVKPQFVELPQHLDEINASPRQPLTHRGQESGVPPSAEHGMTTRGGGGLIAEDSMKSMMGISTTSEEVANGSSRPKKPKFRFPAQTHQTTHPPTQSLPPGLEAPSPVGSAPNTPRILKKTTYPSSKLDVIQPLRLGCNDVMHPDDAKFIATAALGELCLPHHSTQRSRPNTARSDGPSARLYPQPAPTSASLSASARPASATKTSLLGGGRSTLIPQAPLIQYSGLTSNPSFITSDLDRLQPPTYSPRLARPPSAPAFPYQRKTLEMSHQTDTLLQEAVDKATHITSRIVSNLRQRRLVTSQATGGRKGDGRVFLTLEQQPIPQELVRAVAMSSTTPRKRES